MEQGALVLRQALGGHLAVIHRFCQLLRLAAVVVVVLVVLLRVLTEDQGVADRLVRERPVLEHQGKEITVA